MMVVNWRPKEVVIQAVEWTGRNHSEVAKLGHIVNLDSLDVGDYIVKDHTGQITICPRDLFLERWERHLVWDENV